MKNKRYSPPKNPNILKILEMRKIGYTFYEIGVAFGISRQRAHQIWKKYKISK